ncbi:MAG: hypothetical protein HYX78_14160 [Armatimonadetes bacterium]|nr:hypothetical protein [Armatimonadota bacterium]
MLELTDRIAIDWWKPVVPAAQEIAISSQLSAISRGPSDHAWTPGTASKDDHGHPVSLEKQVKLPIDKTVLVCYTPMNNAV